MLELSILYNQIFISSKDALFNMHVVQPTLFLNAKPFLSIS